LIVTLTVNPAIDRIIGVDHLAFEDRSYILSSRESAGGRGINASLVLHSFGSPTLAVLTSGGEAGQRIEGHVRGFGYAFRVVKIKSESRSNLTITDRQGLTVNLNETGPELDKSELDALEAAVKDALSGAAWLMLCGSLAPGVPSSFYAKLIAMARRKKVQTLLHAGGDALAEGVEAKPTVVTPNQHEAERLVCRTLVTRAQYLEAAQRIRAMGPESAVLSLGSRGAVGAFTDGLYEAIPPRVDALCPIGSGDALAAAYIWRIRRDPAACADALRWGVANGTASARLPGVAFATFDQAEEIYRRVELRRAE
jgi:1-phosphofructokinase family hexose kinase